MHRHIGIYSGTFDPVHPGHIAFALEAKRILHLDKVIFLPEPSPRRKQDVTDIKVRLKLLDSEINSVDGLETLHLSTPQFTSKNTLPKLHRLFKGSYFVLLLGSDVIPYLPNWEDVSQLIQNVSFVVGMRAGDSSEKVVEIFADIQNRYNIPVKYTVIDSPHPHLASSQLKKG